MSLSGMEGKASCICSGVSPCKNDQITESSETRVPAMRIAPSSVRFSGTGCIVSSSSMPVLPAASTPQLYPLFSLAANAKGRGGEPPLPAAPRLCRLVGGVHEARLCPVALVLVVLVLVLVVLVVLVVVEAERIV